MKFLIDPMVTVLKLFNIGDKWANAIAIAPYIYLIGYTTASICIAIDKWSENEKKKEQQIAMLLEYYEMLVWKMDKSLVYTSDLSRCFKVYVDNQAKIDSLKNEPKKQKEIKKETEKFLDLYLPHDKIDADTTINRDVRIVSKRIPK